MRAFWVIIIALIILFGIQCGKNESQDQGKKEENQAVTKQSKIHILHAGSLSIPFKQMATEFMKLHPEYNVLLEGHGSRTCARQISDLGRQVEIMASADSAVIRNLLMPEFAEFCIDFTTNEMVLMYTEKSKYSDSITAKNWYEVLSKPDVQYGHSDPNADPCGYRAVLCCQLAESHYKIDKLYRKLILEMPKKNIRPKETDLIALLESGELDYIFIYRSVAEQHHAKYLVLPDEINLKSTDHKGFYQKASVKISGKKPGEWIEKRGAPMVYGITIPKNAKNPKGAETFLSFVLGPKGREIMKRNGQVQIIPPIVDNKDKLPQSLKKIFN